MKQYYNISIYCNIYYCNTIQYGLKEISIYYTLQYIVIYYINCNIYYCNTIQYGLKEISIYCTLQYIAIYCNVCCLNYINTQSLHHKIWLYRVYILYFTAKTHIPI